MSFTHFNENLGNHPAYRLTSLYIQVLCCYLGAMIFTWLLGYESIYQHPTPFYALYQPAFNSLFIPGTMLLFMFLAYWALSQAYLHRSTRRFVGGLVLWGALILASSYLVYHSAQIDGQPTREALLEKWALFAWHLPALGVFVAFLAVFTYANKRFHFLQQCPSKRQLWGLLLGLAFMAFCFACAVAMIREGTHGIAQAYTRHNLEVVGDIGVASSIKGMFARYVELQPHLSLHGRVHPPGPAIIVWNFSYLLGQGPLALSLATVAFGAMAVIPLYFWVREIFGHQVALYSALLYIFVPSVVLFGATSADILFPPITLSTLFLFERALRRASIPYALAAGLGYALMGLMKYSLFGVGIYFALAGLWFLLYAKRRRAVIQTALVMFAATLGMHLLVWYWSGFDIIESMRIAKEYVDHDRFHEHNLAPRAGFWAWRLLNPLAWLYFAGIPISLLFFLRLRWRNARYMPPLWILAGSALVQAVLYLGAGEGERSALYVFPFLVIPAAHLLHALCRRLQLETPLYATLAVLAFQCWLTESYFYTYW